MPNPERRLFLPVEDAATDQEFVKNQDGEANLALDSSDSYRLKFNQDGTIRTLATTTGGQTQTSPVFVTPTVQGAEGANAVLNINADEGDDTADQWDVTALAASATLRFSNASLTGRVDMASGTVSVIGEEAGNAALILDADEGDDNADTWTIQSTASDNDLDFINHTSTVASISSAGVITHGGLVQAAQSFNWARAKVGATSGWVLGGADNLPYVATMAASQAAGTLVIPLDNLHIGDTITGYTINAQVESAGNTVTIDAALRAVTNVAAEPTDAAIGTGMTQVSVTADTAVSQSKTGHTEAVAVGKSYYILITATTGASTDIILQHGQVTVTTS